MGVHIRDARGDDLERIVEIERECYSIPWSLRAFRSLMGRSDARVLIAEIPVDEDGEISSSDAGMPRVVGHGVLWHVEHEAELANLAVDLRYRRRGIATRLLEGLLAEAARTGVRSVVLEVRRSNDGAISLYERRGFRQIGVRRHYYERPREDALILRKLLSGAT